MKTSWQGTLRDLMSLAGAVLLAAAAHRVSLALCLAVIGVGLIAVAILWGLAAKEQRAETQRRGGEKR